MSVAETLSRFTLDATPSAASADAQAVMALSLYDWMACGMAGMEEPVAKVLRGMDHAPGQARVFGSGHPVAPAAAAWINGATSHALDYDDTHFAHIGHPSVAVFPAAMALGANGADTLWAALIGAEVSIAVGLWLGRTHYQTGFHQTATAGAFGATAAAGRLLRLTPSQMNAAFGIAATQAAGLKSQFGTMGKPYHAGLAARTGVEAALLAQAGFDTRGEGVDGPQGFGPTHHGENNLEAFEGLGNIWRMETVSHKFHSCCHGLHAMLETLDGATADGINEVFVHTHPRWLSVCNIAEPRTGLEVKFSYRHTAAMALSGISTAALNSYTDAVAQDPTLVALREKVRVEADDQLAETEARVVLKGEGGERILTHDLQAPLSLQERTNRLRKKVQALLGTETEGLLWQATAGAEAPNADALNDLMCF